MAKYSDATALRAPPADPLEAINWLTDETAADRRKESYWLVVMLRARNEIERLRAEVEQQRLELGITEDACGMLESEVKQLRARVAELDERLQIARGALADIAGSKDMTLTIARVKSRRVYDETAAK